MGCLIYAIYKMLLMVMIVLCLSYYIGDRTNTTELILGLFFAGLYQLFSALERLPLESK